MQDTWWIKPPKSVCEREGDSCNDVEVPSQELEASLLLHLSEIFLPTPTSPPSSLPATTSLSLRLLPDDTSEWTKRESSRRKV